MNKKNILDADFESEKRPFGEIDIGTIIIFTSIIIEIILIAIGDYLPTCGLNFIDTIICAVVGIGSIFIYQIFKSKVKNNYWIIIFLSSTANLFLGLLGYSIIC